MIPGFVEISQEAAPLAEAEAVSSAEALGGGASPKPSDVMGLVGVGIPSAGAWAELASRLALARRCLIEMTPTSDVASAARVAGGRGGSAVFRRIGRPSGGRLDETVLECGRAYKGGGGTIDLETPAHRFWLAAGVSGGLHLYEEVASVDRQAPARRKMPLLPFRRPISLPPKLARAAVNLARVRATESVLDPFLGTGALLAESGLLGGRLYGIDRDPNMVRGALQNFTYLGVAAQELLVGDARSVEFAERPTFSAVITDPPYGRSSSTGEESREDVIHDVVERWARRLTPDGRLVVILPEGAPPLPMPGKLRFRIPVRVHRSLTREFRLYEGLGITQS